MRTPDANELLTVWEQGSEASSPRRALAMLAVACPQWGLDELRMLGLGRRNELLSQLRERLFGPVMTLVAACPACGEQLESTMRTPELDAGISRQKAAERSSIRHRDIVFRPPAAGDLVDLPADPEQALRALLLRCAQSLQSAAGGGAEIARLSAQEIETIADSMAAADPQADTSITLRCSVCNHCWNSLFDIAAFLWHEVDAWARRTLREVHALARAYAWSERDVLAMSPTRRRIYLELSRA